MISNHNLLKANVHTIFHILLFSGDILPRNAVTIRMI